MGTNCAALLAELLSFCYERDFMLSLSDNNQSDVIQRSTVLQDRDGIVNIDKPLFLVYGSQIYPAELQLNSMIPLTSKLF